MRGYILLHDDGRLQGAMGMQGRLNEVEPSDHYWTKPLQGLATRLKQPGLYRATYTVESGYRSGMVTPGKRLGAPTRTVAVKEAARLDKLANKQNVHARTGMPGITFGHHRAGFQHMEDMATARLHNVRSESLALANWLRDLPLT